MAKKKKKKKGADAGPSTSIGKPKSAGDRISRPFAEALKSLSVKADAPPKPGERRGGRAIKPVPPAAAPTESPTVDVPSEILPSYSYEDRAAYLSAFGQVRPLGSPQNAKAKKVAKPPRVDLTGAKAAADAEARARLGSLVADGMKFEVNKSSDGMIDACRVGAEPQLRELRQGKTTPEAQIDLHGLRAKAARERLVGFLRQARGDRRRFVLVIHGKGSHSKGGEAVLRDEVYACLTRGAGAPLVDAFTTASIERGGTGATLVRLRA